MSSQSFSRRRLLSAGVIVGSTAALDAAHAHAIEGGIPWHPGEANKPDEFQPGVWQYLMPAERDFIDAAISRFIPKDDLGPGAKEAGVTVFIDRQLAGPYGRAAQWYMQGPWEKGDKTQGYQSRLTPAELYRAAIKAIDAHCSEQLQEDSSRKLSADQQDKLLHRPGGRQARAERRRRQDVLQDVPAEHDGRLLLRSDLRRQPRHGGLEADRLPRRALRLPALRQASTARSST